MSSFQAFIKAGNPAIIVLIDDAQVPINQKDVGEIELLDAAATTIGTLEGWKRVTGTDGKPRLLVRSDATAWDPTGQPLPDVIRYLGMTWKVQGADAAEIADAVASTGAAIAEDVRSGIESAAQTIADGIGGASTTVSGGVTESLGRAFGELTSYPFPTTDALPGPATGPTIGADQRVDALMTALVGPGTALQRLDATDRKLAAREVQGGRVEYVLTQPAIAGPDATGAGITGDQATALAFAVDAQQALATLSGIESLVPEATDEADVEATRALATAAWDGFTRELGIAGGPDTTRSDLYLQQAVAALISVGQQLFMLAGDGEPSTLAVYSPAQEQARTEFMNVLRRVQAAQRGYAQYLGSAADNLGRTLVLLQQALDQVSVTSASVASAMDLVRVGAADRHLIPVDAANTLGQSIGDLLDWTTDYARTEAVPQLESSGLRAFPWIEQSLTTMAASVRALQRSIEGGTDPYLPLAQARVLYPLNDLAAAIGLAQTLAGRPVADGPQTFVMWREDVMTRLEAIEANQP